MHRSGGAGSGRSRGSRGHGCCLHHRAAEYRSHQTAFLADGLREGLRLACIGPDDVDAAQALADVGELDRLLADGAVRVLTTRRCTGRPARGIFGCADGAIGLAGQFDRVAIAALGRVLARLGAGAGAGALVVDLADVEYVDHRLLLALSDYGRANGVQVAVRAIPPFATRLLKLLPASYLRLAVVGAES